MISKQLQTEQYLLITDCCVFISLVIALGLALYTIVGELYAMGVLYGS